ncbi:MAG: hypothetical protein AB1324_03215 [Candidatus Micrarchaeota archaeon]
MASHRKGYSLEGLFGIAPITDARILSSRLVQQPLVASHAPGFSGESVSSAITVPTMRPPSEKGGPEQKRTRPPPPPSAAMRRPSQPPPGETPMQPAQPEKRPLPAGLATGSALTSLDELLRMAQENPVPEPGPAPPGPKPAPEQKPPDHSVLLSLNAIRDIEKQRVAGEKAGAIGKELTELDAAISTARSALDEVEAKAGGRPLPGGQDAEAMRGAITKIETKATEAKERLTGINAVLALLPEATAGIDMDTVGSELDEIGGIVAKLSSATGRALKAITALGAKVEQENAERELAEAAAGEEEERASAQQKALDAETDALIEKAAPPKEDSIDIPIEVEEPQGIPVSEDYVSHRLSDEELLNASAAFPDRIVRWILPAPEKDTKDPMGRQVLEMFENAERVVLNGREYLVSDGSGVFAGARRAARTGNILHVWPEAITDYEFLGRIGARDLDREAGWPPKFDYINLSGPELAAASQLMPEGKPRWLHPVPDMDTRSEWDRSILEDFPLTPRISIGDRQYYVLDVRTVGDWRNITLRLPKCRIAHRSGDALTVLDMGKNGEALFFNENYHHSEYYGEPSPPPGPVGVFVRPHHGEAMHVDLVYSDRKDKWLSPLPERVDEMDIGRLQFLIGVCNDRIGRGWETRKEGERPDGISPLLSLGGRWYVALPLAWQGARRSAYDEEVGAVRIYPENESFGDNLAKLREQLAAKRRDRDGLLIRLPSDPGHRVGLMRMFPVGELRYLYFVQGVSPEFLASRQHVIINDDDGNTHTALVYDRPQEGAIPVIRAGDDVRPPTQEELGAKRYQRMVRDVSGLTALPEEAEPPRNGVSGATENEGLIQATTGDIVVDRRGRPVAPEESSETMQVTTGDLIVERKEKPAVPADDGEYLDLSTGDMVVERSPSAPDGQAPRKSTAIGMPAPADPQSSRPPPPPRRHVATELGMAAPPQQAGRPPPPRRNNPEADEEGAVELPSGEYRLDEE